MPVLDIARIVALVQEAEEAAVEEVADFVAADAKSRAPVRKVFREKAGFKRKFRPLTSPEKALAIRRAIAYGGSDFDIRRRVAHITNYGRAELRRPGSANSLARSRTLRNLGSERTGRFVPRVDATKRGRGFQSALLHPLLTSRGRYEVSSGPAVHREASAKGNVTHVQIGGRLKASIENEGVISQGDRVTAKVSARVRYAKYVEFPTTHNASQPFLLPALHGNRGRLRTTLARELKNRLGG